ncbi:MAG TPA: hypothetical protein GX514_08865 [Thermoanaerobacterales bacterium]|uniref:YlbF family regulator n=1 Tax=Tepidanaerobacter sp. GT38 TaxID=2722793 RepID=UPI00184A4882|nr:YlbF family regulator [Tepidanaerobacter sp. GT38]MCG1012483.1 YlbF family regulator [Tepidanaerobacter sp. GT38]HHY42932.1 hypothetical protein [Thermoanaerobacterales bacterium]
MNVYDAAHQLARSLIECPEYIEFKRAKESLKQDAQAEKMLKDLRSKQIEVQTLKLTGKPADEAEKMLQNLYNIISHNSLLKRYLEAEERFAVLFSDIQNIIMKGIDLDIDLDK